MKKIISLTLVLMLVLSLTTAAFAVDVENHTNRAYKAYQIFAGQEVDGTLTFTGWGDGINPTELLAELSNGAYKAYFTGCSTYSDVADVLLKYPDNDPVARHFANVAARCVEEDKGIEIAADATNASLAAGYYVLIDQTNVDDKYDTNNAALLQVTNKGTITMSMKVETPVHEKNILTTDDKGDHNHTTTEDYSVGDVVDFHLRAELPVNVRDFEEYRMVFHDDMSDSLTFVNDPAKFSISVTYNQYNKTEEKYEVVTKTLEYGVDYTVDEVDCELEKDCDVHFVIDNVFDFMSSTEACDAVFVINYQAILNKNAQINTANPNEYALEFSNDPNWNRPNSEAVPPTGITPWDKVEVYTTQIVIEKINGLTGDPLTGAEFTLTGEKMNNVKIEGIRFDAYTDTNYEENNKYWLMNDNTYTPVDPATPDIDTSNYANDGKVYKKVSFNQFLDSKAADVTIKAYVDENGVLKFSGLAEGTYTITESVVPTGFNPTQPVTVTIMFNEETKAYTYQWDGGKFHDNNTVTIANYSGSRLPETGGMGTTLFYVIGGLMVAAAAVLLVTKKRVSAE